MRRLNSGRWWRRSSRSLILGVQLPLDIVMDLLPSASPKKPAQNSASSDASPVERMRLLDMEEKASTPLHENADHIRSLYSQHLMSAASATAYGLVGLLMGFVNKAVLIQWPYPNSFLTLQMVASIVVVYSMSAWGLATVQPLHMKAAKALLPVVFFYNTNVAFALAAVKSLSIPVYHVLKRLTPVMVLLGCILAGFGDLSFVWSGYSAALISCVLQTTYLLLVERSGSEKGFNSMELLLYNGILSLPVLLVIILGTGEVWDSVESMKKQSAESIVFVPLLAASLLMGSLLNYCLFLCTLCNSALTTTIVGTLRSVLGTVMGFFVFGGVKGTNFIFWGVAFNTAGGVWYTLIKYKEKQEKAREASVESHNGFKGG